MASDVITWLVPYTAASVDCVDTSTLFCFFGISGLWLQDRTIRQLKEEAQHLSKLGVQHIMWGLDGLVLACLWRLCILSDTVLVFSVLMFLLLRRCLLLVVLRAIVVKQEPRKNMPKAFAWPSMLGCTSYLEWYNVVYGILVLSKFQLFSKRPGNINLDAEWSRRSQFLALLTHFRYEMREEQGIGCNLQCPTVELDTRGKSWILPSSTWLVPTWSRCCLGCKELF